MLKTTNQLISYLNKKNAKRDGTIITSIVNSIFKSGSKDDANELLIYMHQNPTDFYASYLMPVLKKFGDKSFAEKIYEVVIENKKLKDNIKDELLELIAYFKYEPVKPILAEYAFGNKGVDYYLSKSSVLGLLNFDCKEYQKEIRVCIKKCYNKNLFPEYIPALVCKLEDQDNFLEPLFELGDQYASTDCNAGIILGFSLCGDKGLKYFKNALFSPNWEASDYGTGTISATYQGVKNLNLSFKELYIEIKQLTDKEKLEYSLDILFALLKRRILDYDDSNIESFEELYTTLYTWENENTSNNIVDLARAVGKEDYAYSIERYLELKMTEELILKNYIEPIKSEPKKL